ncbi:hypothetical protein AGLY_008914 [Aphis glycines]|uniref:Uncharacterized protein n=1 Tax=Aphis glycines TaxID=307491 RepID=A0A6G0TKC3_APHGL|nr:hypothetical protein AGLY_008914 [Aphis glycines]
MSSMVLCLKVELSPTLEFLIDRMFEILYIKSQHRKLKLLKKNLLPKGLTNMGLLRRHSIPMSCLRLTHTHDITNVITYLNIRISIKDCDPTYTFNNWSIHSNIKTNSTLLKLVNENLLYRTCKTETTHAVYHFTILSVTCETVKIICNLLGLTGIRLQLKNRLSKVTGQRSIRLGMIINIKNCNFVSQTNKRKTPNNILCSNSLLKVKIYFDVTQFFNGKLLSCKEMQ